MKELLEYVAKSLAEFPDDVCVTETGAGQNVTLQLKVNENDMGRIIGKQGRIAKAIRSLVKAAAMKENKKATVEITQ